MDGTLQTALSPNVRRLVTQIAVHNEDTTLQFLSSSRMICWESLNQVLPDLSDETDTADYFEKCIYGLGFLFRECEKCFEEMTLNELVCQYSSLIQWTGQEKVIKECFRLFKTDKLTDNYIVQLLISSCLERALGDVYLLENKVCPSMLKDILSSSSLKKRFGPIVIQVLRAVIGPPISLNLRNVIWHGFPSEQEISKRYTSFLLLVIPSLNQFITGPIPHREPVLFPQDNHYKDILPDISDITIEEIKVLLESSHFIQPYHLSLWKSAIDLYDRGQTGMATVAMLPLLEHGLRCLFTSVNNCSQRTVTAEATTLYTTLDEILDQYVTENQENKLPLEIGHSVMEILLDLFTYPHGPRVRDKLSHGEADIFIFPKSICTAVFIVVIYFSAKYQSTTILKEKSWLKRMNSWADQYESLFHPISLVKSKLKDVVKLTGEFNKNIKFTYTLQGRTLWTANELMDPDSEDIVTVSKEIPVLINLICNKLNIRSSVDGMFSPFADGSVCLCNILKTKIHTLYRYQKDSGTGESEIVNLLLRIAIECETVIVQVFTALQCRQDQLKNKTLRSRQRNNLQSLIKSCFVVHQSIHLVLLLTACHLVTIETKTDQHKFHIKCLKMVLQYTENLRTYTNTENNKWTECVNLSLKTMVSLKQFLI